MAEPLWRWDELVTAASGVAEGTLPSGITGVSIDTRTLQPGDLFVALRGDNQNGEAYVIKAFENGAAAALVSDGFVRPTGAGPLVRVADTLQALERLGIAARARLSDQARVIAVTGSVGKTSTKEMLRVCLREVDPRTHASEKSYNNHWGVPLTLARMPADTRFGVFEIGMNHAGEIAKLSPMVRPHVAVITEVGPVHIEFFPSVEAIADAKAEIFLGLEPYPRQGQTPRAALLLTLPATGEGYSSAVSVRPENAKSPGGAAILNANNEFFPRLLEAANRVAASTYTFGVAGNNSASRAIDSYIVSMTPLHSGGSKIEAVVFGETLEFVLGASGSHQAANALAALTALSAIGLPLDPAIAALRHFEVAAGRGAPIVFSFPKGDVVLIDESYNANLLSMSAALSVLRTNYYFDPALIPKPVKPVSGRIAILGDMRELGDQSGRLHRDLLPYILDAHVTKVFACGPFMRELFDLLPESLRGAWRERSTDLIAPLLAQNVIQPGDVIMVKGSLGTNMKPIVDALKADLGRRAAEGPT